MVVFLLKDCEELLHCKSYSHFIDKNVSVFAFSALEILMTPSLMMLFILNNWAMIIFNGCFVSSSPYTVLQIRRGENDDLGIIFHITPLKLTLGPIFRTVSLRRF